MIDVTPQYAGQLMSVSNTIATITGIPANLLTGYILEKTGNWLVVFSISIVISVLGGIYYIYNGSGECQDFSSSTGLEINDLKNPSTDLLISEYDTERHLEEDVTRLGLNARATIISKMENPIYSSEQLRKSVLAEVVSLKA
jgi:hypothetical protein